MSERETEHLRILIADPYPPLARIATARGHEVIARRSRSKSRHRRGAMSRRRLGESSEHALGLIEQIVQEAACPVIVLLHVPDPSFIREAPKRGVLANITARALVRILIEWSSDPPVGAGWSVAHSSRQAGGVVG